MPDGNQRTGKEQKFYFDNLDLTDSLASEITWTINADEIDASTINSAGTKAFLQSVYESSFDISGVWRDSTATTSLNYILYSNVTGAGTKLWKYYPSGSATGRIEYSGNAFLTSYEISGAVDGMVGFSATLRNAGSVLWGTV